jgi:hypothetical protein
MTPTHAFRGVVFILLLMVPVQAQAWRSSALRRCALACLARPLIPSSAARRLPLMRPHLGQPRRFFNLRPRSILHLLAPSLTPMLTNVVNACRSPKRVHFGSKAQAVASIERHFSADELLAEPRFKNTSFQFVYHFGGPITRMALDALRANAEFAATLSDRRYDVTVDVRVNEYRVGQLPDGGNQWHVDLNSSHLGRGDSLNFSAFEVDNQIYMLNLSSRPGGVSNAEILLQSPDINLPVAGHIYQTVHRFVDALPRIDTLRLQDGVWMNINQKTIHRGSPAHGEGVRIFFRVAVMPRAPNR